MPLAVVVILLTAYIPSFLDYRRKAREAWPACMARNMGDQLLQFRTSSRKGDEELIITTGESLKLTVLRADYVVRNFDISNNARYYLEGELEAVQRTVARYPLVWFESELDGSQKRFPADDPILPREYDARQVFERLMLVPSRSK